MKIAFISGYHGLRCGVAVYGINLVKELSKLVNIKVFAEKVEGYESDDNISYCWSREELYKIDLIKEIDQFKPDIILVNHEFGYFPRSYQWVNLLSYWKWRRYKIITIFHSIYSKHLDKTVNYAACPNILVHSEGAKLALVNQGIEGDRINIIKHGMYFLQDKPELLPSLYNTWGAPTLFFFGFNFLYKGVYNFLDIFKKIKDKYPTCHFVAQLSENPKCQTEHDELYEKIMNKIEKLDLLKNVSVNKGFASLPVILSHIRTSTCCILPYLYREEFNVFAASGSARIIMSTTTPLVVRGNVNLFNDLKDVVLSGNTDDEIYHHVCNVLDGKYDYKENNEKRIKFINDSLWSKIAISIVEISKDIV